MTAQALLTELHNCGASIAVVGDRLRVEAPTGTVTPALRQALADHKRELLALLASRRNGGAAELAPASGAARNEPGTLLDRIEGTWKPGEWLAYRDGNGQLLTARYAGTSLQGNVNVWLADGALRAIAAEAVVTDWSPDAAEVFEERLSIMLAAGVPEDVARVRAEQCTCEYFERLQGLQ